MPLVTDEKPRSVALASPAAPLLRSSAHVLSILRGKEMKGVCVNPYR